MGRLIIHLLDQEEETKEAQSSHKEQKSHNHNEDCFAPEFWKCESYDKYISDNGEHFNAKSLAWACSKMENRNGISHTWTAEEVNAVIKGMYDAATTKELKDFYTVPKCNYFDVAYLANMHYADRMGSSAKSDLEIIKLALDDIHDVDGYKSKAFAHWLTDMMYHKVEIPFNEF